MQDKTDSFYADMQRYIAVTTVGPSALRNQGRPGVIETARRFLSALDIRTLAVNDEKSFLAVLDTTTAKLRQRLPLDSQHWGAARKALNLFLREICYNRFLSHRYSLALLEPWMEIPLDSLVAAALKSHVGRGGLPNWAGLKGLTPPVSLRFQHAAKDWADAEVISRVHLDMRIWVKQRTKLANKALHRTAGSRR
ncbi:MAG: hypothetical protein IH856_18035 [Deltaproteobacteria bacterium]|nr:hypothetical protein [Deltaproteobacteria bacterium]